MEQLEDAIQDHREFLMDLDSHKSLLLSINVVGAHLAEHASDEAKAAALQKRLADVNEAWDVVCEEAAHWQTKLQTALLEVKTVRHFPEMIFAVLRYKPKRYFFIYIVL
jgi:nesprin-1